MESRTRRYDIEIVDVTSHVIDRERKPPSIGNLSWSSAITRLFQSRKSAERKRKKEPSGWRIDRFVTIDPAVEPNREPRYFSKTIVYFSGKPVMAFTRDRRVVNKICIVERAQRGRYGGHLETIVPALSVS